MIYLTTIIISLAKRGWILTNPLNPSTKCVLLMTTDMATDDVELTSLLMRKRDGVLARVAELRVEMQRFEVVRRGIDDTLRLLDPSSKLKLASGKSTTAKAGSGRSHFAKGECLALMQQALREAGRPLTTTELVQAVVAKKMLPASEEQSVRLSVRYVMRKEGLQGAGITVEDLQASIPRWVLVDVSEKTPA
jgi:hypothetical protein